jgi:hypothetical protein
VAGHGNNLTETNQKEYPNKFGFNTKPVEPFNFLKNEQIMNCNLSNKMNVLDDEDEAHIKPSLINKKRASRLDDKKNETLEPNLSTQKYEFKSSIFGNNNTIAERKPSKTYKVPIKFVKNFEQNEENKNKN